MNRLLIFAAILLLTGSPSWAAQKTVTVGTSGSKAALDTNFGNTQDNFTELYSQAATKWVSGKAYTASNQLVTHGGYVFVCTSNHTAGATTEPGTGASWATAWKYHGADLYEPLKGDDDNYVTDAEKTRIRELEATDSVSFSSVTATGSGGLVSGVQSTTQGGLTLYSNVNAFVTGILPAATPTGTWSLRLPPAAPGGANYLFNVDADGTGGWTDPATLGGDDLGSASYSDVVALWTTCTGYLKSDGTCDTPSGSATYPAAAGVANWGGSAWGTSYTLDTDLSTTSASDDTLPSAKSVKALVDGLPTLTIQTTAITTGANNILGSGYGLVADTDGDGSHNDETWYLSPATADGKALGSATLEVSDAYFAAGAVIYGENDQSNTITSSSTGWNFNLPIGLPQSNDPDVGAEGKTTWDANGDYLRVHDGTNQIAVAQKLVCQEAIINKPNDLADATRDAVRLWQNNSGMNFVVTSWSAQSSTDNTDLNIETTTDSGGTNATVDAVSITTDGTSMYYASDSTITAGTIATGSILWLDFDDTDAPDWVGISVCGYFNGDVN